MAWHPPPDTAVKVNVDGSSFGNPGQSGFGGVIRDSTGTWHLGFSGSCGYTTNLNAELHAIYHGLRLAWNNGFRKVLCESDSMTALDLISSKLDKTHPYFPLVDRIKQFKHHSWELSFHHSLREGNFCADWLAKFGSSMDHGLHTWNHCPTELASTLLADAMGILRLRD